MKDLTIYSDQELSLQVFNDEYLYLARGNQKDLIAMLRDMFKFTEEQLQVLKQDLAEDAEEMAAYVNNEGKVVYYD